MSQKERIITALLITGEIGLGALLGQIYINQYSLWTSSQTLGQFFLTVILIYCLAVLCFGTINLRILKKLGRGFVIRCIVTALCLGIIFALPIFLFPFELVNKFDFIGLDSLVVILLGLWTGFNFQLLRGARGTTPHNKVHRP